MRVRTSLTEPNAFPRDWYGWVTNQISHIGVGVFLAFLICAVYFAVYKELPYRVPAYLVILSGYLAFEILAQGYRGLDSIEDTVFTVGYGASAIFAGFSEIYPGQPLAMVSVIDIAPFFVIATLHLTTGALVRARA